MRCAERRETFGCSGTRAACHDAACQALARRLASHDAGRSPLGAPPWRFWASGPRFRLRHPPSLTLRRVWSRAASSSQPGRSAWRATSRASRGKRLRAARRRTPRPAPHSGSSLEHALNEQGCEPYTKASMSSQEINSACSRTASPSPTFVTLLLVLMARFRILCPRMARLARVPSA